MGSIVCEVKERCVDASSLLTIEVFLLTAHLLLLALGNREPKVPNPISEREEP